MLVVVVIIIGATLLAHGWSLADGRFLDDHWHHARFADDPWSVANLFEATTIQPSRFVHMWWQERDIRWEYVRPFWVLLSKGIYRLTGHSVVALHAFSLLLHLAGAFLLYKLCFKLTHRRDWSLVGTLLFVVYSHSVYAVGWLAAQNSVLQTVLTLASLLCYVRASGLNIYAGSPPDAGASSSGSGRSTSAERCWVWIAPNDGGPVPRLSPGWLSPALLLWLAALFSRESAIMLPAFYGAFDLAFGGWRVVRRRWWIYAVTLAAAGAFAVWRLNYCAPLPDFYLQRYDGPGYVGWWLVKLLHYITAAIWLSPMLFGPTVRHSPITEVPLDCLLMLAITGIMTLGYVLACRGARGWWIWPMWVLLAFVPVTAVMATPQSGYLPSIGFAVAMMLGPALRHEIRPTSIGRWSRPVATWFLIATCIYIPIYRTMWHAILESERITVARVLQQPPPVANSGTTHVFFMNLPFVNIYIGPHLRETDTEGPSGRFANIQPHVLTYASHVMRMDQRCAIEQLDDRRFSLRITEGRGYFSGALGRFLIESMTRDQKPFTEGTTVFSPSFNVHVREVDADGVRELEFEFPRPLDSPEYVFYLTTHDCAAARLTFHTPRRPDPALPGFRPDEIAPEFIDTTWDRIMANGMAEADVLFAVMAQSSDGVPREHARRVVDRHLIPVMDALGAPLASKVRAGRMTADDWRDLHLWWHRHVTNESLRTISPRPACCDAYAACRHRRDALARIREITAWIIRTDLYTTGPPFPSPR